MKNNQTILGKIGPFFDALYLTNNPQDVLEWLDGLSWFDPQRVAADLNMPLVLTNQQPMPNALRFKFMETLVGPLRNLSKALAENRGQGAFPAPKGYQELATEIGTLIPEYLNGYQIILAAETSASALPRWLLRDIWPVAAHRMMELYRLAVDIERVLERGYPAGFWQDIVRVYRQACDAGWTDIAIPNIGTPETATTIEYEFRRLILLSQLPPGRVDARTEFEVEANMDRWVEGLHSLYPYEGWLASTFVGFGIPKEEDAFPIPINTGIRKVSLYAGPQQWSMLISAFGLEQRLTKLSCAAEQSPLHRVSLGDRETVSAETLGAFRNICLNHWSRIEPRHAVVGEIVAIWFGVAAAHRAIGISGIAKISPRVPNPAMPDEAGNEARQPQGQFQPRFTPDGEGVKPSGENSDFAHPRGEPVQQGKVLDRSAHGLRLEISPVEPRGVLVVGELLAVSDQGRIHLAEVRWIEQPNATHQAIGLSILCADPIAVAIRIREGAQAGRLLRGFVAPDAEGHPVLIMPAIPQIEEKSLSIVYRNRETPISLLTIRTQNAVFTVYRFTMSNERVPVTETGVFERKDLEAMFSSTRTFLVRPAGVENTEGDGAKDEPTPQQGARPPRPVQSIPSPVAVAA